MMHKNKIREKRKRGKVEVEEVEALLMLLVKYQDGWISSALILSLALQ